MEQNRVQEITRRAEELLSAGFEDGKYNDEMSWNDVDAEDKSALIEGLKEEFGVPARTANYFLEDAFETVKRDHNIKDDPEPEPLITDLYDEAFPINEGDIMAMVNECMKRIQLRRPKIQEARKAGVDSVEFFLHNEEFVNLAAEHLVRCGWPDRDFDYRNWIQEMGNILEGVNNDVNDPSQNEWNGPIVMSLSKIRKILKEVFPEAQKKAVIIRCGGLEKAISYCRTAIEKKIEETESFTRRSHYDTYGVAYAAKRFFEKNLPTEEYSTPPGSQGYLAGEIARDLNQFYNFPRLNDGHPYAFERMMANVFIESEEGRKYLEDLVTGDTEGLLNKRMNENRTDSMKINESDIKVMVAECIKRIINEGMHDRPEDYMGNPGEPNFPKSRVGHDGPEDYLQPAMPEYKAYIKAIKDTYNLNSKDKAELMRAARQCPELFKLAYKYANEFGGKYGTPGEDFGAFPHDSMLDDFLSDVKEKGLQAPLGFEPEDIFYLYQDI